MDCGELGADDGVDPREWARERPSGRSGNRKALQLCRQVAETLDQVLSGDCRDEDLQSLHVVAVDPCPDSSRLLITLESDLPEGLFDRARILERLEEQAGRLRSEVAGSIARKRVPMLAFRVVGMS
jgi:ribosome-binding factor A